MSDRDWIELGVITQPHGVDGRVKIKSFTEPAEQLGRYKDLTDDKGRTVKLKLGGKAGGLLIARIEGIADRNAAELWRGRKLGVPQSAIQAPKQPDSYRITDLIGMDIVEGGRVTGRVKHLFNFGAGDIIEIDFESGESELFAFTTRSFPTVDVKARRIRFERPEMTGSKAEEEGDA